MSQNSIVCIDKKYYVKKSCGNCIHMICEDTQGNGWCEPKQKNVTCNGQPCGKWNIRHK